MNANKFKKIACVLAVCLFAVTLLFSVDFIASSSEHECHGTGCETCALLQTAERNLSGGNAVSSASGFGTLILSAPISEKSVEVVSVAAITPVSLFDVIKG